jgi:hypothetical protein
MNSPYSSHSKGWLTFSCEVIAMRLEDHLDPATRDRLNKIRRRKKNKVKKDPLKRHYSERELKELMGLNRDRYERGRGGSLRRK